MHRRVRASSSPVLVLVALALALVAACDKGKPAAPKTYPDTAEGFAEFAKQLVATVKADRKADFDAIAKQVVLPDPPAWFARVFGPEVGARLHAEYAASIFPRFDRAWPDLRKVIVTERRDQVATTRHTDPKDDLATGHQSVALRAMQQPVALYRLQLTRPDGSGSFTLWSWVHEAGTFRIVGKMKQADPIDPNDEMAAELDMLGELPMVEARRAMKEARGGGE